MLSDTNLARMVVLLLSALVAITFLKPVIGIPLRINKNYNEGWNAYQVQQLLGSEPLYPSAEAFTSNNYPPLSFYLVGGLSLVVGDPLIGGRVIALLSLLGVAFWISRILLSFGAHRFVALCTSLVFLAFIGAYHSEYVGMNDPQWFAHAVMMAGLALLIRRPDHAGSIVGAAALMVTAGFVKHNLVSLPIAATIWMITVGWRPFLIWIGVSIGFVLCAFGGLYGIHGPNALAGIFGFPRSYSLRHALRNGSASILRSAAFVAAGILLAFAEPRSRATRLVWLYLLIAGASGYLSVGGAGAAYNHLYDFVIASTLAAGLAIDRIGRRIKIAVSSEQAVQAAGVLALSVTVLFQLPVVALDLALFLRDVRGEIADAKADVVLLKSQSGPVACEMLALCFWAGKPFEIDFFGTRQKLLAAEKFPGSFLSYVEQRRFAAIQLQPQGGRHSLRLPDEAVRELVKTYRIERRHENSIILVRMADLLSRSASAELSPSALSAATEADRAPE